MITSDFVTNRKNKRETLDYDLVVVGGGITGVTCAITAAREGIKVALIQDRPVLGGNASSEVRIWMLGATSHMANNNRWSREGGLVDELMTENLYRNKEGNPVFLDALLIDKVCAERNIDLFLNTSVSAVTKNNDRMIASVDAFNSQNSTEYRFSAPLFADCSGDGIVGYLSGASFRIGAEDKDEFGEQFIADKEAYGEVLGHTIFFYTKQTDNPVEYHAPDFAIKNIEHKIIRINNSEYFNVEQHGCKYWWIEYGGRLDTVYDTEKIKYELWRVVYGIWDYIKNSGKYPQTSNQTLEWVGIIPGKRESRRFCGYYTLTQNDIILQNTHYDAVAFGGWSIDLHPADGVYSSLRACNQWHSKGIYQIPYRCYLSKDIDNLLIGGRIISVSHVANGSTRVMCTCAYGGEVIGLSAAMCTKNNVLPAAFMDKEKIKQLQRSLIERGHHIPNLDISAIDSLLSKASISVSSTLKLDNLGKSIGFMPLAESAATLLSIKGNLPRISLNVRCSERTSLEIQLRTSERMGNFTPCETIGTKTIHLDKGEQTIDFGFDYTTKQAKYLFICFMRNEKVEIEMASGIISGVTTVYNTVNPAVSNYGKQVPPADIGIEEFEFWCPKRIPNNSNIALHFHSPIDGFEAENLSRHIFRPVNSPNCWSADWNDITPWVDVHWNEKKALNTIRVFFDSDYDQALETVQMNHFFNISPHTVRNFSVEDGNGNNIAHITDNHNAVCNIVLKRTVITDRLVFRFERISDNAPVSVMGIIVK